MLLKVIGLLGGLCFAYCGVPTAWKTIKAGRSIGTPVSVAWMIFAGAVLMYSYLTASFGLDWILTLNYGIEALSWGVVIMMHYNPGHK